MTEEQITLILANATRFFKEEIVPSHLEGGLARASDISEYNINPFTLKYLAVVLTGNNEPESLAKALIYPRVLGTSITTIFGAAAAEVDAHGKLDATITALARQIRDQL